MKALQTALLFAALAAIANAAHAVDSQGGEVSRLVLHGTSHDIALEQSALAGAVTEVNPGDTFAITGDCVKIDSPDETLRVVLTFADALANVEPGFRSVLPTDQEFHDDSLHVRVPDMPEALNRVFAVKVFHLGEAGPEVCDAGSIRIGGNGERVG